MHTCDMENFYAMSVYIFLITGSEHEDVISEGSGEPALLCNLVRVTLLTNSKFLSG